MLCGERKACSMSDAKAAQAGYRLYKIDDSRVTASWKNQVMMPSTLYFDVTLDGTGTVTGKSNSVGLALLTDLQNAENISSYTLALTVGGSGAAIVIPLKFRPPALSFGNFMIDPTNGATFGWFSHSGSVNPYLMLASGVMSLIQTVFSDCSSFESCSLDFGGRLIASALPINSARNILQRIGFSTDGDVCDALWSKSLLTGCFAYLASYKGQSLTPVAESIVEKALRNTRLDPFTRAALLYEADQIEIADEAELGIFHSNDELIEHIFESIKRTDNFNKKYSFWMKSGDGARPNDEELSIYMADLLYLARKLQMSAEIKDGVMTVKKSAPLDFAKFIDAQKFFEVISDSFHILEEADAFWLNFVSEISRSARFLVESANEISPEALVAESFKLENALEWKREITSGALPALFVMKKIYLAAKTVEADEKSKAAQAIANVVDLQPLKIDDAFDRAFKKTGNSRLLAKARETAAQTHAIETILQLTDYRFDRGRDVVAFDLTKLAVELPIFSAFVYFDHKGSAASQIEKAASRIFEHRHDDVIDEIEETEMILGDLLQSEREMLEETTARLLDRFSTDLPSTAEELQQLGSLEIEWIFAAKNIPLKERTKAAEACVRLIEARRGLFYLRFFAIKGGFYADNDKN